MSMLSRRNLLQAGATGIAMLAAGRATTAGEPAAAQGGAKKGGAGKERWLLSLNMSTIRPASLEDKVAAAQKAGYDAVELWSDDLDKYEKAGKSLEDLAKRIKDGGMYVVNIIGIWNSMPQDAAGTAKRMEEARRKLAHAQKVGAQHIAAIPAPDRPEFNVLWAAGRYRELVDLGKEFNVKVAVEFVSFFQGIHTLGQAAAIAMESERPEASVVADTFHMHNGHSAWSGVGLVAGPLYAVWHVNDVPATPEPGKMKDSDRIYPGDGILPLVPLFQTLWKNGFRGPLSLEMFNAAEYKKPADEVAKTGIEKMRAVIAKAGVGT